MKLRQNLNEINNTLNAIRKEDPKMNTLNKFFPSLLYNDIPEKPSTKTNNEILASIIKTGTSVNTCHLGIRKMSTKLPS